jgi:hypothetical protein
MSKVVNVVNVIVVNLVDNRREVVINDKLASAGKYEKIVKALTPFIPLIVKIGISLLMYIITGSNFEI